MGRKRKTRWRRLSIGEISGNEEDGDEMTGGVGTLTRSLSSSQNHSPIHKPYLNSNNNHSHKYHSSSNTMTKGDPTTNVTSPNSPPHHNSSSHLSDHSPKKNLLPNGGDPGSNEGNPTSHTQSHTHPNNSLSNGVESRYGYNNGHHQNNYSHHHHQYESHYDRYHYHKDNYRPPSYYNGGGSGGGYERGSSERGGYYGGHGGHHKDYHGGYQGGGYHGGGGGYRGGHGYNGSYNRSSSYNNASGNGNGGASSTTGSEGYSNGGGGGDYYAHHNGHHPPSRSYGPGRFRRSRSYPASNYYYPNGAGGGAAGSNCDNTNKPSYNQEEYTKITTPRQDVLFKKGYLSQKKPQSSVESASTTTTPTASTNGTPDTQSTNGINSDYSEGYENGETDCVIPYDDASYYYPPPEAVFTDPTGQVYYGHCSSNGEYYDAYPVSSPMMVAGYPAMSMYYPVPYPVDWNGVPIPYPMVAVPPQIPSHSGPGPHIEEIMDLPALQGGETTLSSDSQCSKSDTTSHTNSTITSSSSSSETESPLSSPTEQTQESVKSSKNLPLTTPTAPKSSGSGSGSSHSSSCLSEEKAKSPQPTSGESSSPKSTPIVCPAGGTNESKEQPSKTPGQGKKEQKIKTIPLSSTSTSSGDKDNNNLSKSQPTKDKSSEPNLSSKGQGSQRQQQQSLAKTSSKDSSTSSMSSPSSSVPVSPPGASGASVPRPGGPPPVTTYASAVGNANIHSNSHPPPPPPLQQQQLQQGQGHPQPHPHSMNNVQHFQHPPPGPRYHHPQNQQMGHHGPPPPHNGYHHHGPPPPNQQHQHPHPPPHMAMTGPPPPPQYMYHPHPPIPGAGFVYGPPVYNGVAPASADTVSSSPSKKRKKRRKEKDKEKVVGQDDDDDGQLTDEASSTSTTEYPEETSSISKNLSKNSNPSTNNSDQNPITQSKKEKSPEPRKTKTFPPVPAITSMQIETNAQTNQESISGADSRSLKIISRSPSISSSSSFEERVGDNLNSNSNSTSPSKQSNKLATRKEIFEPIEPVEESEDSGWKIASNSKSKRNKKSKSYQYRSPLSEMREKRGGNNFNPNHSRFNENSHKLIPEEAKSTSASTSMSTSTSSMSPPPLPLPTKDDELKVSKVNKKKSSENQGKKTKMVAVEPSSSDDAAEPVKGESSAVTSDQDKPDGDNAGVEMNDVGSSVPSNSLQDSNPAAIDATAQISPLQLSSSVEGGDIISSAIPEVERFTNKKPSDLDLTLTSVSPLEVSTTTTTNYDDEFLLPKDPEPEPSSPSDSLNTTQSLAGSEEVAAISVSESDFLNMARTTSLDEVEEDLPEEGLQIGDVQLSPKQESSDKSHPQTQQSDTAIAATTSKTTTLSPGEVSPVTFSPEQLGTKETSLAQPQPKGHVMEGVEREENEIEPQPQSPQTKSQELSPELSPSPEEAVADMQKESKEKESFLMSQESKAGLGEQEKVENVTDIGQLLAPPVKLSCEENSCSQTLEKVVLDPIPVQLEGNEPESEVRPKSLTLVVSEWLKTQGEGALTVTPIGPGSGEEGDEDLSQDDDDDEEDEYDEEFEGDGSNLNLQNQKNGHCNPWAVSSSKTNYNKDGSISGPRVAPHSRHSSSVLTKKDAIKSVNQTTKAIHHNQNICSNQADLTEKESNCTTTTTKNINYDSGYELSSPEELLTEESNSRRKNHRKSLERESTPNVDHHHKKESKELGQPIHPESQYQIQPQSFASLDEQSNPTEICDPQKFSKYYQFGVVFDPEPPEKGFDFDSDSGLGGEGREKVDPQNHDHNFGDKEKADFLQVMMKTNKNLERKQNRAQSGFLPSSTNNKSIGENKQGSSSKVILLRGTCDQDDDEDIGTFDPEVVAAQRQNRRVFTQFEDNDAGRQRSNSTGEEVNLTPQFRPGVTSPSSNIYVNPMSLAKELVDYSNLSGDTLSSSWDVDSEPLPPYESPPSVDIPIFNGSTPQHRIIRRKLGGVMGGGDPIPSAICCSIQ